MSGKDTAQQQHRHKDELEWIQFRTETMEFLDAQHKTPNRFIDKFKENPFVPIGAACTVAALSYGLWSFRKGQVAMSQKMMRMRVAAQGLTIVALMGGLILSSYTTKTDKV